jgi:hypothetical protein
MGRLAAFVGVFFASGIGSALAQPAGGGPDAGRLQSPVQTTVTGPPAAIQSFVIHQDTLAEREEILRRRAVSTGAVTPTAVSPLRGELIAPAAIGR